MNVGDRFTRKVDGAAFEVRGQADGRWLIAPVDHFGAPSKINLSKLAQDYDVVEPTGPPAGRIDDPAARANYGAQVIEAARQSSGWAHLADAAEEIAFRQRLAFGGGDAAE